MTVVEIRPQLTVSTDLRNAILATLAYSDVFDFPLNIPEISRFLIRTKATASEISAALSQPILRERTSNDGEFWALSGREHLFSRRRSRHQFAQELLSQAIRFGKLIGRLPFIRMVAVTGAVAAGNGIPGTDLDYLLVTKPGWLWLCRLMTLGLNRLTRLFGLRADLCPNYLVTENALALQERDLFSAEEFARMIPVYGVETYQRMRKLNTWVEEFLPNAYDLAETPLDSPSAKWLEPLLAALQLGRLESWEMRRKIKKFSRIYENNNEARFSPDYCKGHFAGHKEATERAFQDRLNKLGIDLQ